MGSQSQRNEIMRVWNRGGVSHLEWKLVLLIAIFQGVDNKSGGEFPWLIHYHY